MSIYRRVLDYYRPDLRTTVAAMALTLLANAFKYTPAGGTITLSGSIAGDDVQIAEAAFAPRQWNKRL